MITLMAAFLLSRKTTRSLWAVSRLRWNNCQWKDTRPKRVPLWPGYSLHWFLAENRCRFSGHIYGFCELVTVPAIQCARLFCALVNRIVSKLHCIPPRNSVRFLFTIGRIPVNCDGWFSLICSLGKYCCSTEFYEFLNPFKLAQSTLTIGKSPVDLFGFFPFPLPFGFKMFMWKMGLHSAWL